MLSKEAPQEAYVAWLVDGAGLPFVGDDRVKVGFTEGFCAGEAASLMDRSAKLRGVLSNWYKPVRELCESKGWRRHEPGAAPKEGHEFPAYIALLHSEATEALEAFRDKLWSETCYAIGTGEVHKKGCSGRKHDHPKPIGVGPEFADVFIRLIDMCDMWGIDLDAEVDRVMAFGWTRPFQHGGRIL